jgi:hypothetical protein
MDRPCSLRVAAKGCTFHTARGDTCRETASHTVQSSRGDHDARSFRRRIQSRPEEKAESQLPQMGSLL